MTNGLIEAFPRPVLLLSANGRVAGANGLAKRLFGDAIVGRHHMTVVRQPMLLDAIEAVSRDQQPAQARYLITGAQKDVTLMAYCAPVDPDGGIMISFEDHTMIEEAGQIRRDFVANVSHELKTPLTALMGFIETLQGAARDDAATQRRFLEIMKRESLRMNRLVGDLLSLSRVEAEERVRPTATVDLAAIARGVLGTLEAVANESGVVLKGDNLDIAAPIPGDADQLSQVVTNLVENAVKYSGKGARVEISICHEDKNPMVMGPATVLTVADTGDGIESRHIPRLTERFYRVDSHRSREMGGTGLGLAIVKHILNRHRGRLKVESEKGKGSRFSVILPEDV